MSWNYFPVEDSRYYGESIELYKNKTADEDPELNLEHLPEDSKIYYIEEVIRAHSSGIEQSRRKFFKTFNMLLQYLIDYLPTVANEEWEDDDFFADEKMKVSAPAVNTDFLKIILNPQRLYNFINSQGGKIYGPYSKFCLLVPYEMHLHCTDLYE
jgi:hypothetical protein